MLLQGAIVPHRLLRLSEKGRIYLLWEDYNGLIVVVSLCYDSSTKERHIH